MSKFTKGPWRLNPEIASIHGHDGQYILTAGKYCLSDEKGEGWANATLIAAAPELLEALKEVLNSDMAQREEDEGQESKVLNLVRKAIAKAEGRE